MLDPEAGQFVAAKTTPKAQQQQRSIAGMAQLTGAVIGRTGLGDGLIQPGDHLAYLLNLKRLGLLFTQGVQ